MKTYSAGVKLSLAAACCCPGWQRHARAGLHELLRLVLAPRLCAMTSQSPSPSLTRQRSLSACTGQPARLICTACHLVYSRHCATVSAHVADAG